MDLHDPSFWKALFGAAMIGLALVVYAALAYGGTINDLDDLDDLDDLPYAPARNAAGTNSHDAPHETHHHD